MPPSLPPTRTLTTLIAAALAATAVGGVAVVATGAASSTHATKRSAKVAPQSASPNRPGPTSLDVLAQILPAPPTSWVQDMTAASQTTLMTRVTSDPNLQFGVARLYEDAGPRALVLIVGRVNTGTDPKAVVAAALASAQIGTTSVDGLATVGSSTFEGTHLTVGAQVSGNFFAEALITSAGLTATNDEVVSLIDTQLAAVGQ